MKKISSLFLVGAALAACTSPAPQGYEISGTYADSVMHNNSLYLMDGDSIIDSTVVAGKTFSFKGDLDTAVVYRIAGKSMMRGQVRYNTLTRVLLDKGTKLDVNVTNKVTLTDNGGSNQILSDFMDSFTKANQEATATYQSMLGANASQDSIQAFAEETNLKLNNLWKETVAKNTDNLAGAAIFADFCRMVEPAEFDSIYQQVKYADLFDIIKTQKNLFDNVKKTSEGEMFVDFAGKDMEGNAVKLSDYVGKGKYVLVDFWASW